MRRKINDLILPATAAALGVWLSGCATVPEDMGFEEVRENLAERTGYRIHWNQGTVEDVEAEDAVHKLLHTDELTEEAAVQVALLNNRRLQAKYADIGVAQADLVQEGLLRNPVFGGEVLFPLSGGSPKLGLELTQNFLQLLMRPARRKMSEAEFAAAKYHVSGEVLDRVHSTRQAFYEVQGAQQRIEMFETILEAVEISYDFARRLYEAGNITALHLKRERAEYERAKMALARAEDRYMAARERLNVEMGLWGEDTAWTVNGRLPDPPEEEMDLEAMERRAVAESLNLKEARERIQARASALGLEEATSWPAELEAGVEAEGHGSDWKVGPTVEFPIPLFDRGQARRAGARAELLRARDLYFAEAVEVRSAARMARDRLVSARDRALYQREVIIPLTERITEEAMLQYNAMAIGLPDLLMVRNRQIEAGKEYTEALRDYWSARATAEMILAGRKPEFPGGH